MSNRNFLNLLFGWVSIIERAHQAKQLPPEQREKVSVFGIHAVIYAFLTALCACTLLLLKLLSDANAVLAIFIIIGIILGGIGALICLVTTLVNWFCQLAVNKSSATWTTLIFVIVGLALAVGVPLLVFAL